MVNNAVLEVHVGICDTMESVSSLDPHVRYGVSRFLILTHIEPDRAFSSLSPHHRQPLQVAGEMRALCVFKLAEE